MRTPDLIEGKRYILNRGDKPVGTYQGKHGGKLTLADGSIFYGGDNMLRFTYIRDGEQVTVLFNNGTDVIESEDTRVERENQEAAAAEVRAKVRAAAAEFLANLGFEVVEQGYMARDLPNAVAVAPLDKYASTRFKDLDSIEVEAVTIGKLKAIVKRGQPIAAR